MAKEPEDLVLRLLRDIRATQTEHGEELRRIRTDMERQSRDFSAWRKTMLYGVGLADEAKMKNDEQDAKLDDLFDKLERLLEKQ